MSTAVNSDDRFLALMHATTSEVKRMVEPKLTNPRSFPLLRDLIESIQINFDAGTVLAIGSTRADVLAVMLLKEEFSSRSIQKFDLYVSSHFSAWDRLWNRKELQADRQALIDFNQALRNALVHVLH